MSDLTVRSRAEAQRDIAVAALETIRRAAIKARDGGPAPWPSAFWYEADTALAKIAEIDKGAPQQQSINDDAIRQMWRAAGGDFHGPHIEHAFMEERKFLPFMRQLIDKGAPAHDDRTNPAAEDCRVFGMSLTDDAAAEIYRLEKLLRKPWDGIERRKVSG
jgi:hypothetical protein